MKTEEAKETVTCGKQKRMGSKTEERREGNMKFSHSFTTLSTIAIQAGQSQVVISVLKSGSLVHLQLVQVQPELCEIGSSQEENRTLIKEQQQLLEKLKKHEQEVLTAMEKKQQTEKKKKLDEGMRTEGKDEVMKAMVASLREGWSLLLSLLGRRQEVLMLALDFYQQTLEFAASIDKVEDLLITADNNRPTEVQLPYHSMRRELLRKSFQVLRSSNILFQKLKQLQRTEALQRQGGVLHDHDEEEVMENFHHSTGITLRLEELVEKLQDRRQRVDDTIGLKLQQVKNSKTGESGSSVSEDWSLTVDKALDQILQCGSTDSACANLQSDSRSKETSDTESASRSHESPGLGSEHSKPLDKTGNIKSVSISPLKAEFKGLLKSTPTSEEVSDVHLQSELSSNLQSRFIEGLKPQSTPDKSGNLLCSFRLNLGLGSRPDQKSESKLHIKPGSRIEETRQMKPGLSLEETRYFEPGSLTENNKDLQSFSKSGLRSETISNETSKFQPGLRSDMQTGYGLDLTPDSSLEGYRYLKPGTKSEKSNKQQPGFQSWRRTENPPEFRSGLVSESQSVETRNFKPESRSDLQLGSRFLLKPDFTFAEVNTDVQFSHKSGEITDLQPGSRSQTKDVQLGRGLEMQHRSRSKKTRDLESGFSSLVNKNLQHGHILDLMSFSKSEETTYSQSDSTSLLQITSTSNVQPAFGSEVVPESRSEENQDQQSESRSEAKGISLSDVINKQDENKQHRDAAAASGLLAGTESMLRKDAPSKEDTTYCSLLTNQKHRLLLSFKGLTDKVCGWLQQSTSALSNINEAGQQLFEAEGTLNTHLNLHTQAQSAAGDVEKLKHILNQLRALQHPTSRTSPHPPSESSRQLSPLKALTEQLKKGSSSRENRTTSALPTPPTDPADPLSPEFADRVDVMLEDLQCVNRKVHLNLQLLQPYVTFLRTAKQLEEELQDLRKMYSKTPEEGEENQEGMEAGSSNNRAAPFSRSPVKKKKEQVDACWHKTLQRLLTAKELGSSCSHTITMVSGSGLNLQSMVSVVQQTMQRLDKTKQEVEELWGHQQIQIQQQQQQERMQCCTNYQERLLKTWQDLNSVSDLLDSCTLMDLGSDLQTSRLLEHFSQARPHFGQLNIEVEHAMKTWEQVRGVHGMPEVKELKGGVVKEADLSELLKLQRRVKDKIQQSESVLNLTSSFHVTAQQLEALLRSDPARPLTGSSGFCGPIETELHREEKQQIQTLLKTASTLKRDICTAVSNSDWTGFQVEQLEARLLSLESLCVSWLNEATQHEEKLRREQLTHLLHHDINQLRDSFKDLKKRFSNLKFSYMKRNDRTRNMKAVRNHLQQVELYEEKLQRLRKRMQEVMARLGSEVKNGDMAREVEDAANELQRQMGELERSVCEHQNTLDLTCRLQQAMEEYQFWCEEASATIARVEKFSLECRSTEAISVLCQQFEKFVWPTVPQQEERINQMTELAIRLHGVEEGQRYIEKTISKHSEMLKSIRELSNGLMELEAKLKLESLKEQQEDDKNKIQKEEEMEREENKGRKMKKKEHKDNCSTQEAADMHELKETGHTPELTTEHDGKEVPVKMQAVANRRPPLEKSLEKSQTQPFTERFTSTHIANLSCSPVEANRRAHTIHSQPEPLTTEPQDTTSPSVESQREERQERRQQAASTSCELKTTQDAPVGGLPEAELHQQEALMEDSLSSDEYDCASPDDISLPPLAETPESNMVHSDLEDGFCFSSHNVNIHQHNHQCYAQSEQTGSGTVAEQQLNEPSHTQTCLTYASARLHSRTRFTSESSSFVQSPLTAPAPCLLKTEETSTSNIPQNTDLSLVNPEPRYHCSSNPVHENTTSDTCSKKVKNSQKRSPLQITQDGPPKDDPDLYKTPYLQDVRILRYSPSFPQARSASFEDTSLTKTLSESRLNRAINSSLPGQDSTSQSKSPTKTITSAIGQQTLYFQQSPSDSHCTQESPSTQNETWPQIDQVPKASDFPQITHLEDPVLHKDKKNPQDTGFVISSATFPISGTTSFQDDHRCLKYDVPQTYPDSSDGLNQDVPFQSRNKSSLVSTTGISSLTTTTTVTQQTIYCQSFPLGSQCSAPQARNILRSQQDRIISPDSEDLPDTHAPCMTPQEPSTDSNSSTICSCDRFTSRQSNQTVCSHHECLTSTFPQQCVHDPGMTASSPVKPIASSQPEAQIQALAQQANPHVTPFCYPPHLLTSGQDPDICLPIAIREEIRLTPQIQGPPIPDTLPQPQAESLPQGKASRPGPSHFTRPVSKATLMEGSPVTLEVEVTGQPEPTLTWFKDEEMPPSDSCQDLPCEDVKFFLLIPEVSDSDGGLYETRAAHHPDSQQAAGTSSSSDKWLMAGVFDIISVDWQTWFGTLCVMLWLLYLIVL